MEFNKSRNESKKKVPTNGIVKQINLNNLEWPEHITEIDLSDRKIIQVEESIKFPPNLVNLNLSHNALTKIVNPILNLDKLKNLDLSHNKITYFDDCPKFYDTIEKLNISHNDLFGPPYWIWTQSPKNLIEVDLSFNFHLTNSLDNEYLQELLEYKTTVCHIKINNCNIRNHLMLLSTFSKACVLEIGSDSPSLYTANRVTEIPFEGLANCCDIERLRLRNTMLYTIKSNIGIFTRLIEINLSQNYVSCLPEEFCNLFNLEICILSMNQLLYLPEGIGKLKKLTTLNVNSNELCMLPESIVELVNLRTLDLYDNCLYEIPSEIRNVPEIDLAQNYFEEPDDQEYLESKGKLRLDLPERYDKRKIEAEHPDSDSSNYRDEEYFSSEDIEDPIPVNNGRVSSPEDWDSDDYWVPRYSKCTVSHPQASWLYYVKKKMNEGNFCPMDAHQISITEKVKYEKLNSPYVLHESDGQFDDYSDDNS